MLPVGTRIMSSAGWDAPMSPGGRAGGLPRGRSVPQAPGFALRRPAMAAGPLFSAAPGKTPEKSDHATNAGALQREAK